MSRTRKTKSKTFLLVAPDRPTGRFVAKALADSGLKTGEPIFSSRGWVTRAKRALTKETRPLLLVPSPKLGPEQISLAQGSIADGNTVIAWSAQPDKTDCQGIEQWLVERLLVQAGALLVSRLSALIEAARILSTLGDLEPRGVHVKGPKISLSSRVATALKAAGITTKTAGHAWTLSIEKEGKLELVTDIGASLDVRDPRDVAEVLGHGFGLARHRAAAQDSPVEPDRGTVEAIVRPPGRLLSEITSKRLMAAYGIDTPRERLCQSASEAVRYAKSLGGKAVLKLARPKLASKKRRGAVIMDVEGPAAVRRAVHSLESLAHALGPPAPLGILVAEQIEEGARTWVCLKNHDQLGRLMLAGPGDCETPHPSLALSVPASFAETHRAVAESGLATGTDDVDRLSRTLTCFANMAHDLGPRINRAEIHPLVTTGSSSGALALDALVSIAG